MNTFEGRKGRLMASNTAGQKIIIREQLQASIHIRATVLQIESVHKLGHHLNGLISYAEIKSWTGFGHRSDFGVSRSSPILQVQVLTKAA